MNLNINCAGYYFQFLIIRPYGLVDSMETMIPEKAYFRIGEVSKIVDVEPYVIRYWETEFKTVSPVRTRTAQRLYRRKDVQELLTIKNLLYSQRFTIDGAKKQLHKIKSSSEPEDKYRDREKDKEKDRDKDYEKLKWLVRIKEELQEIRNLVS